MNCCVVYEYYYDSIVIFSAPIPRVLVAQWLERLTNNRRVQVRFLAKAQFFSPCYHVDSCYLHVYYVDTIGHLVYFFGRL